MTTLAIHTVRWEALSSWLHHFIISANVSTFPPVTATSNKPPPTSYQQDNYATELCTFICRESEIVNIFLKFYLYQEEYQQRTATAIKQSLPLLNGLIGKSSGLNDLMVIIRLGLFLAQSRMTNPTERTLSADRYDLKHTCTDHSQPGWLESTIQFNSFSCIQIREFVTD